MPACTRQKKTNYASILDMYIISKISLSLHITKNKKQPCICKEEKLKKKIKN